MTSTPFILLLKRTGQASDRPSGVTIQAGEMALSFGGADPGMYFEDSAGDIRKVGSNFYGSTAPNSTPIGLPGNSIGETWTTSSNPYYLQVWTGSVWQKVGAGFADTATSATTATTANTANTAILASGAVLASGSVTSQTALLASGAILASGSVTSQTALLASGAVLASGSVTSQTALLASGAILASGVVTALGLPVVTIVSSGLPAVGASGTMVYNVIPSGAQPSGLFVSAQGAWIKV
jgi:hypothetical protein